MRFRIVRHDVVDSTNERAFAALAEGRAHHGDVHVARAQTAGRGRLGRRWESAAGEGMYASIVLLPEPPGPPPALLSMATALAVRDAVLALGTAPTPRLDWPNDVEVDGAKLAGLLIEARGLDPAHPHFVVGIGINVAQREFSPELEAERPVTSLALLGRGFRPEEVLAALLPRFADRLEEVEERPKSLTRAYAEATGCMGKPVELIFGGRAVRGVLLGLEPGRGVVLGNLDGAAEEPTRIPFEHVTSLALVGGSGFGSGTGSRPSL